MTTPAAPIGSLVVAGVAKRFGAAVALLDLTLTFVPGESVLLLGANGAGKSTLLRVVSGLIRADSGRVGIQGSSAAIEPLRPVDFGYVGPHAMLYGPMSVRENLAFFAAIRGMSAVPADLLAAWGIERVADRKFAELSKGMQMRVSLAAAFMHDPRVLLLDEPSGPLDAEAVGLLLSEIERARSRHGGSAIVIIATHDLHRLLGASGRCVVLENGGCRYDLGAGGAALSADETLARYLEINR